MYCGVSTSFNVAENSQEGKGEGEGDLTKMVLKKAFASTTFAASEG